MAKLTPPVNKDDHAQGSPDAPVTLVEYGDFQCPHCGAAHPILKQLQQMHGKNMRLIFRHFPLSNSHPMAIPAAMAAEAAARQGKFWEMHDMIFEHQDQLSPEAFIKFAGKLKLDIKTFEADSEDVSLAEKVDASFESGVRSGVNGTPSFFINGAKYNGGYDAASLSEALTTAAQ